MDFELIGLQNRDKRVYEALVMNPEASVRRVAEYTGINRGTVFELLKDLIRAGLVTRILYGKRIAYRAKDPLVLTEILKEKQHELSQAHDLVQQYADSFGGRANNPSMFHFASSYNGDEGLAAILRDVLKTCRTQELQEYRVISSPKVSRYLYNNFPHFSSERVRLRIAVNVLRQGQRITELADYATSRYLGGAPFDTGCYTIIYGTKVAIITINKYNQTSGAIIDNVHFAEAQRQMFDATWSGVHDNNKQL